MRFMRKLFAKRPHRSSLEMVLGYNQKSWLDEEQGRANEAQ
ncbi:MAG: hypothetical protein ACTHW1_05240 [Ancrocorticia sp.]